MRLLTGFTLGLATTLLFSSATVFAQKSQSPVTISDNQMIRIKLPDEEWEQVYEEDSDTIIFSDGLNEIAIDVYDPEKEIPYTKPGSECETIYTTFFMTRDFVVVSEGLCYEDDEEVFDAICKAMKTIKIDKAIAKKMIPENRKKEEESEQSTEKDTDKEEKNGPDGEKTGEATMVVDDDGNTRMIYEYTDGYWYDEDGNSYNTTLNREGYYFCSDGKEYRIASDRGENVPDYIVYGQSGLAHELYDNGDGTATDGYGNPYQYAGDDSWIDYYGNYYYEGGYRDGYERNDYTENDYGSDGEYITSVDGITRYVYWQNEFYAVDDEGNEYIYSGKDGSLRSSDGLEF